MRCCNCKYYESGCTYNRCNVIGDEYFHMQNDCKLVNDDNTINENELKKAFGGE